MWRQNQHGGNGAGKSEKKTPDTSLRSVINSKSFIFLISRLYIYIIPGMPANSPNTLSKTTALTAWLS